MKITEEMKMKKLLMTLVLLPLMAFSAVETTADGYSWTYSREGKGVKITNVSRERAGGSTEGPYRSCWNGMGASCR